MYIHLYTYILYCIYVVDTHVFACGYVVRGVCMYVHCIRITLIFTYMYVEKCHKIHGLPVLSTYVHTYASTVYVYIRIYMSTYVCMCTHNILYT